MNISVASGTGGTGKTPLATSLVLILSRREPATFLDCDLYPPLTEKLAEWYAGGTSR
jgi:MinD superfamily P-loop ATPase